MSTTVFAELKFWLLIVLSLVIPTGIYAGMLAKRAISRVTVLVFGLVLVALAAVDVYLLQSLATLAKDTASVADDAVFRSEISVALYLLPAMFGGIGINVISHVLVQHLVDAERQFDTEHPHE